ncbi:MAG: DUF6714 family protein [Chloroflexota bacterium]
MSQELREKVAKQIEEAFADAPYPGDENIGWGCGSEGGMLEEAFRGKHWSELSLELILDNRDKLPCTTPEGFRFYMPAWLLAALLHYEMPKAYDLCQSLIFNLCPQDDSAMQEHFLRHIAKFNAQEKAAVLAFLEAWKELHPDEIEMEVILPARLRKLSLALAFWKNPAL